MSLSPTTPYSLKRNVVVKLRDSQPSPFKPTGACLKSSGCTRRKFVRASSSLECTVATWPAYATLVSVKLATINVRWLTTPRWPPSFKNSTVGTTVAAGSMISTLARSTCSTWRPRTMRCAAISTTITAISQEMSRSGRSSAQGPSSLS